MRQLRRPVANGINKQSRKERHEAIADYTAEMAGTALDLDDDLEAAGVEHLSESDEELG